MVLTLIQVEPGLLARSDGHREATVALGNGEAGGMSRAAPSVLRLESLDSRGCRVVLPIDGSPWKQRVDRGGHPGLGPRHAQREALDHAHRPIAVHDEAGKSVRLAPAEPVRVRRE